MQKKKKKWEMKYKKNKEQCVKDLKIEVTIITAANTYGGFYQARSNSHKLTHVLLIILKDR